MNYLSFVRENRRFLAFGFLLSFFSSFGQTYFIAVFSADLREAFTLTHGGFGFIYSSATLASALSLVWLGRLIDRIDLRRYAFFVCAGLAAACFFMALVPSALFLYPAIFALRITGQGLMVHTSVTSMARYFAEQRGKAVSIASFGSPVGQGILALGAVMLSGWAGWRWTWAAGGALLALFVIPLVLWTLRGSAERRRRRQDSGEGREEGAQPGERQWSRREVLRDMRFYLILPVSLAPSFIVTGIFFHMVHFVESKGWSLAYFTGAYFLYSTASVAVALLAGPLIDRVGAARLLPWHLAPMALALVVIGLFDAPAAAAVFMVLCGISVGCRLTIGGAIWAEFYGVAHLGSIRALATAFMVFSSALSPAMMGWLIDFGVTMETIVLWCAAYIVVASLLVAGVAREERKKSPVREEA